MANYCSFEMKVTGNPESLKEFQTRAFDQKGFRRICDWSGDIYRKEAMYYGGCKWNVQYSMDDPKDSISEHLSGLSKELKLKIEIWSSEIGCCFQEHLLYDNGKCICSDTKEWHQVMLDKIYIEAEEYMPEYKEPQTESEMDEVIAWYNKRYNTNFHSDNFDENLGTISVGGFANYGTYSI